MSQGVGGDGSFQVADRLGGGFLIREELELGVKGRVGER